MKITVLGGDERSIKLIGLLHEDGHDIKIFGFDKLETSDKLESAIVGADIVIGPLPCSRDSICLNTPLYKGKIEIEEVFKNMLPNQIFIAGSISKEVSNTISSYNITNMDFMKREEMAVLNAIPTAEGAIQVAMENMDITLHGSNAMILGFGRIGKVLAKMLQGLGTNVYVEARNYADLAWINSYGYKALHLNDIKDYLHKMDVVFNTIPTMILDEEMLLKLRKESLVIDLASNPGGVDFEKSKELGIKTVWALALPGKVAPMTAAKVMKETIYNIIEELGV